MNSAPPQPRRPRRLAALLLVGVVLVAGCSSADAGATGTDVVASQVRQDTPPAERPAAPEVTGTTLDGGTVSLADFDGPVVINFWASWCGPCVSEAPHLAAIAEEYADEGVAVLGVTLDSSEVNARTFERDHNIPFPSIHDPSKQVAAAFGRAGPAGLPTTIVLDAEHRVASRLLGAVTARELAPRLEGLLDEADA